MIEQIRTYLSTQHDDGRSRPAIEFRGEQVAFDDPLDFVEEIDHIRRTGEWID